MTAYQLLRMRLSAPCHRHFFSTRRTALLLIAWCSLLLPGHALAQSDSGPGGDQGSESSTSCSALPCNRLTLYFEAVPDGDGNLIDDVDNVNCDNPTGCYDPFRQVRYRVFLRYGSVSQYPNPSDIPAQGLDLDYEQLTVKLNLAASSPSGPVFSNIDFGRTINCYHEQGQPGMDRTANLIQDGGQVVLDLKKEVINACPDDAIHFVPGQNTYVADAELFWVVVNAYAGETISFEATLAYDPPSGAICTKTLTEYLTQDPISPATPAAGTPNDAVKVRLSSPHTNANGNCQIDVLLEYTGTGAGVDIDYLDFRYVTVLYEATQTPQNVTINYPVPNTLETTFGNGNGYAVRHVVYLSTGTDIHLSPSSGTVVFATIEINPPALSNDAYSLQVALIDEAASRIRTNLACTAVDLIQNAAQACSQGGPAPCALPDIVFKVTTDPAQSDCIHPRVQIGLFSSSASAANPLPFSLLAMEFEIEFLTSGNITLTDVDYADFFPFGNCNSDPNQICFQPSTPPAVLIPGATCHKIDGNTLHFCYTKISSGAATQLTLDPGAFMEAIFDNAGGGCVTGVIVRNIKLRQSTTGDYCLPLVSLDPFDATCPPEIRGTLTLVNPSLPVNNADVLLYPLPLFCQGTPCGYDVTSTAPYDPSLSPQPEAAYGFCPCSECTGFKVTPVKNNDCVNGVDGDDLDLIRKHVLGLAPFPNNQPHLWLAADADYSGLVSSYDVVLLNKLVLGEATTLPNGDCWRFYPSDYTWPAPPSSGTYDPLNPYPPSSRLVNLAAAPTDQVDFLGVKVGDIDGDIAAVQRTLRTVPVSWRQVKAQANSEITIPVVYNGDKMLGIIQLGFAFNPADYQFLGWSPAEAPGFTQDNFGLSQVDEGAIQVLWLNDPLVEASAIQPGTKLFYLTFRQLTETPGDEPLLELHDKRIENRAWETGGQEYVVRNNQFAAANLRQAAGDDGEADIHSVSCQPNPFVDRVRFQVVTSMPGAGRLQLFDVLGRPVVVRAVELPAGEHTLELDDLSRLPAGTYRWQVDLGGRAFRGSLVKN
jgi:hypothetical protein